MENKFKVLCIEDDSYGFDKNKLYEGTKEGETSYYCKNNGNTCFWINKSKCLIADYPFKVICQNSEGSPFVSLTKEKIYDVICETEKEYYIKMDNGNIKGLRKSRFKKCQEQLPFKQKQEVIKQNQLTVKNENKNNKNIKGENVMSKLGNMFGEFGAVKEGDLALTMTGAIAVKRGENEFVRYDKEKQQIENQMDMVVADAGEFMFVMPSTDVKEGDVVKVKNTYYQVLEVLENKSIKVVDIKSGTKKTLFKETNLFGFGFWSKVTCLFNMQGNTENSMNPMMMMMLMKDDDSTGKSGFDMKDMLMMSAMQGNVGKGMNPMMLLMMKDKNSGFDMKDMMMMQMLGGQLDFGNMFNLNPKQTEEDKDKE